jgi:mono/diheme cytochrome c family protein
MKFQAPLKTVFVTSLLLTALFTEVSFAAFSPAITFEKKCSSCHSIGDGDLIGPDLKDVTKKRKEAWLIKFIQSPNDMIESGDKDAVALYKEFNEMDMPEQNLTDDQVRKLLTYIESGGPANIDQALSNLKSALKATKDEIEMGRNLFLGKAQFENGGPACISCHSAGSNGPLGRGGGLAKDLTYAYSNYKDKGIGSALKRLAFPIMDAVFADKPLSNDEAFQIKAFLYAVDKQGKEKTGFDKQFLFMGLGGAATFLGLLDFAWRKRRKSSVRKSEGGLK